MISRRMTLTNAYQVNLHHWPLQFQPPGPVSLSAILSPTLIGNCFMLPKICLNSKTSKDFSFLNWLQRSFPKSSKSHIPVPVIKPKHDAPKSLGIPHDWQRVLTMIRFFRIIWNRCYYLNINVLSLFQWAITEVNSNISINVKSSTADRCTYICMYLEHQALAHCSDSMESQKWRIFSMQFSNTSNYVMPWENIGALLFLLQEEERKISYFRVTHSKKLSKMDL